MRRASLYQLTSLLSSHKIRVLLADFIRFEITRLIVVRVANKLSKEMDLPVALNVAMFLYHHSSSIYWTWYWGTWVLWLYAMLKPVPAPKVLDRSKEVIDWPES